MPERMLDPKEVLRVMDAAQVIHERQAALEEHEALDREATIREIQVMYEELGDLVDARVIEKALDEYLAQRYAFTPARPGLKRGLALLYIRRGRVAKRVLAPVAVLAALVWGGFALTDAMRTNALERDAGRLQAEVARLDAAIDSDLGEIRALRAQGVPDDLPADEIEAFAAGLALAESQLAQIAATLAPIAEEAGREGLTNASISGLNQRAEAVADSRAFARSDIMGADFLVERHARLGALEAEVAGLHAAVLAEAVEELGRERAAELGRSADAQLAARDLGGLESTAESYRELHALVGSEYEIVIVGGVWRYHTELDGVRNYYLRVQAVAGDGQQLPVTIRNEEDGSTARVMEWAERVPKEVYDRIASDRQDNGIIDDDDFGFKRRGFVTAERNYEDLGQITRW
ncbi:MAG: hypothetical protein F4107_05550 [Gemmatimonadetes bacterium]|nr:DUF6384 family protein [Gemmatimonadota bacterium]MXX36115.1 hypothetical protein [Gemmatimonadota bacterium]MYD14343.1 hypothetical protein [Gemmatimonadota bacterium]MYI65395.1 hypothetical protein [Gemmatimonadota bacterium]